MVTHVGGLSLVDYVTSLKCRMQLHRTISRYISLSTQRHTNAGIASWALFQAEMMSTVDSEDAVTARKCNFGPDPHRFLSTGR